MDIALGRDDTCAHLLTDPNTEEWIGKDYYNPRAKDFFTVNEPDIDMYDRQTVPRMPWHDVHLRLRGYEVASDLVYHFIERWNFNRYDLGKCFFSTFFSLFFYFFIYM